MEKFIIVSLLIIIILLFSRIRIIIEKEQKKNFKVKLYIFPKVGININLDRYFKKYKTGSIDNKIKSFYNDFLNLYQNKKLLRDFLKIVKVRKISIILNYNFLNNPSVYIYFLSWNCLSCIKNFVDKHVRNVEKEIYRIDICQTKNSLDIYIDMIFPLIYLITIGIKHFKIIMKGINKYGSSNKRIIKTIR